MSDPKSSLADLIPSPQVIRERLGNIYREAHLLRSLLKLSRRAAKEQADMDPQDQKGVVGGKYVTLLQNSPGFPGEESVDPEDRSTSDSLPSSENIARN